MTPGITRVLPGAWLWSEEHRQPCQVIEAQSLWGGTVYRVWLPGPDAVVRVPTERLTPLARPEPTPPRTSPTWPRPVARYNHECFEDLIAAGTRADALPSR